MKKLLLLFVFFFVISCLNLDKQTNEISIIECPKVFFSSENNVYTDGATLDLDLEKVNFKASLNNYGFAGNCFLNLDVRNFKLDLLFIVEPINPQTEKINFPIFALFYDVNNNLIERQYFRVSDILDFDNINEKYMTTDIIHNLNINIRSETKVQYITIGVVKIQS